jgi:hypothetical protein
MSVERMRFEGGALHGKVVWIEHGRATLDVHVGGQVPGAGSILHYRKSGTLLCYLGESQAAAAEHGTIRGGA